MRSVLDLTFSVDLRVAIVITAQIRYGILCNMNMMKRPIIYQLIFLVSTSWKRISKKTGTA